VGFSFPIRYRSNLGIPLDAVGGLRMVLKLPPYQ
jgi:hypothetical protein